MVIDFGTTTMMIGENNVGKTAILEALDIAIGDRFAAVPDLRVNAADVTSPRFCVDLELTPWAGLTFAQGVIDLLGPIYRPDPTGRQRYFLRVIGEPDESRRTVQIRRGFVNAWDSPIEATFIENLAPAQRRSLWFSLIDAKRDLTDDIRTKTSPWGKLLRRLQPNATATMQLEQALSALSTQAEQALPDAGRLGTAVGRLQSVLAGQVSTARISLLPKSLSELWRTTDLLVKAHGHPELSIGQQGMGARSLSAILAFRAWLEAELALSIEPPLLVVTAFEEPEAHLHPQAQRAVLVELASIAGQRVVSTHSSSLASSADLDDLRVIRRAPSVSVRSAHGISADPAVTPSGLVKIRNMCLRRNGDMLFARLVILGEGETEAGVLPELGRAWWGGAPEGRGVAIVPVDGVGNMRTFATFLERMGIAWIALLDGDQGGVREHANMITVPSISPLVATNVFLVNNAGRNMDLEDLIVATGRPAAVRTLQALGGLTLTTAATTSDAEVARHLRDGKAAMSTQLGLELATEWAARPSLPAILNRLFTRADALLS